MTFLACGGGGGRDVDGGEDEGDDAYGDGDEDAAPRGSKEEVGDAWESSGRVDQAVIESSQEPVAVERRERMILSV